MIKHFRDVCAEIEDIEVLGEFRNPLMALDFAQNNRIELAFLDMEMPKMSGLELAEKLRARYHDIIIVFVSAHEQFMPDAFRSRIADYYILKPYTREDVLDVLARVKLLSGRLKKRVRIQTFSRFEIYVDEKPLYFSSSKSKELLALLVDRHGGRVDSEEAFSLMWEDKPYTHARASLYRHALGNLLALLKTAGVEDVIVRMPRGNAIKIDAVDCDYFDFLDGKPEAIRRYAGEYMANYGWGEFRIAALNEQKERRKAE